MFCALLSRICLFCSSAFFFSVSASEIFLKRIGLPGAFTYSSSLGGSGFAFSSFLGSFTSTGASAGSGAAAVFSSAGFSGSAGASFFSGAAGFSGSAGFSAGCSGASGSFAAAGTSAAFTSVSTTSGSGAAVTFSSGFSSTGSSFTGAAGFFGITGLPIGGFGLAPSFGTTGTALILGLFPPDLSPEEVPLIILIDLVSLSAA